jgi:glucosamine--fructose-6-phosphate aminotransferase (isomerizing)
LAALRQRLEGSQPPAAVIGIGHTRWATHGEVTESNAHPLRDCSATIGVVHNGIIENAGPLRLELERQGHQFESAVDTEVVAHLIEQDMKDGRSFTEAVGSATAALRGRFAIAAVRSGADVVLATARGCPLVIGSGPDGYYVASDPAALAGWAQEVRYLRDGDLVEVGDQLRWLDQFGDPAEVRPVVAKSWTAADVERGTFSDYMAKEIAEQPAIAQRLLDRLLPDLRSGALWRELNLPPHQHVRFVACGTSYHAALVAARVLRTVAGVPTEVIIASEHADYLSQPGTLTIAVSQSGETADVLAAVELCQESYLALTNTPESTVARGADAVLACDAGPEIGVAATKTFIAQVIAGVGLGLAEATARGALDRAGLATLLGALGELPELLASANERACQHAPVVARRFSGASGWIFMSRGSGVPYAAEGALKLKELTYRWAEALPAGELKHGPIALIEPGVPVVAVQGGGAEKLSCNLAEVRARGGEVITVGPGEHDAISVGGPQTCPPWGRLEAVVGLQHLARSLGLILGRDVDKPRNLAKSVTVE